MAKEIKGFNEAYKRATNIHRAKTLSNKFKTGLVNDLVNAGVYKGGKI